LDLDVQEEEGKEGEEEDSDSDDKIEYDGIISEAKGSNSRKKKKKINPKKLWFMMSSDWLFQWKCFISNKISSSSQFSQEVKNRVRQSPNHLIGILPPPPICNDDLFLIRNSNAVSDGASNSMLK